MLEILKNEYHRLQSEFDHVSYCAESLPADLYYGDVTNAELSPVERYFVKKENRRWLAYWYMLGYPIYRFRMWRDGRYCRKHGHAWEDFSTLADAENGTFWMECRRCGQTLSGHW